MVVDRSHCGGPQFLQRTIGDGIHHDIRFAGRLHHPSLRLACAAPAARLGLRLFRRHARGAVFGGKLRPTDSPCFRHAGVPRPRPCRYARPRRYQAGAAQNRIARPGVGGDVSANRRRGRLFRRPAQPPAVPDHPALSQPRIRHPRHAAPGARDMVVISDIIVQGVQMLLVLLLAPLLTGFVRKLKARLVRRQGASIFQPYRDLLRLLRKEVVLADNASWLFRVTPYVTFAAIWVAAALVPTFATGLLFNWTADLIAIVALLGSARFFLALAGMDVGTSFGGIGSSREVMIAALAEPAMLLFVFCMALVAGSTQLSTVANFMASSYVGLRVSLGMAIIALIMVALAENARIPVDNPATHLELTMVHEAMVLEYSGRHLAMIEFGAFLKLLLYISLIACVFLPWKIAVFGTGPLSYAVGAGAYIVKLAAAGFFLALFETATAKMRVFRVPQFLGAALMLGLLGTLLLFVSRSF